MSTFEHWYYTTHYKDELDLIYTGWFVWVCDEVAKEIQL